MQFLLLGSLASASLVAAFAVQAKSDFTVHQKRVPATFPRNGLDALKRTYAKFGASIPNNLQRRGAQGTVTNQPYPFEGFDTYPDDEYLSSIYVGTPPQELTIDLDTGSADLWLFYSKTPVDDNGGHNHSYYVPSRSSTSKKLAGSSWNITYGDGSGAAGEVYTDKVTYGGITYPSQVVEAATYVSGNFIPDFRFDGYFGLGHDAGNQVLPKSQKTFFTNIAPTLTKPLFTAELNHLTPGSYDFGFIDPKKFYGPLRWFPSPPAPAGHGWWVIKATGYAVGDGSIIPFKGGLNAIVDTGSTFLLLPQQYCDAYYAKAPFVVNDPDLGYVFPCNKAKTLPDLTIEIGGYKAEIPGYLIQGANFNETTCFTGINPIAQKADIPNAVLGDTFLKTTFTVFRSSPGAPYSLGFAKKDAKGNKVK